MKLILTVVLGFSVFSVAGCVQPTVKDTPQFSSVPLTSAQVRSQLADSSIVEENSSGQKTRIYITSSLEAKFLDSASGKSTQYELLKNGIICTKQPDRRFCYRVYIMGDNVFISYAEGTPEIQGKITKGNIFKS